MEINALALPTQRMSLRGRIGLWIAGATHLGEVNFSNASDLVLKVIEKTRSESNFSGITRLNVMAHGNERGTLLGTDFVTVNNFNRFERTFAALQQLFDRNGFAHIQSCKVGNAYDLLRMFARVWRVPVYAATANYHGTFRFQDPRGDYVRCESDGVCHVGVARP